MSNLVAPVAPEALAEMDLFLGLPRSALAAAVASARIRRLAKDTIVFAQGEPARHCHALVEGSVRITQSNDDGEQVVIRFIGPGDMFGTVALFTDRLYPAEASAVVDSVEIGWTEAALRDLIHRHPQIALNIVRIVGARLREAQERLRELATERAERRIAHALTRLAAQAGQAIGAGTTIAFPLSRKDVAEMAGTTLHTASRVLTAWEKAKLISTNRQRVTIRELARIRRLADEFPG